MNSKRFPPRQLRLPRIYLARTFSRQMKRVYHFDAVRRRRKHIVVLSGWQNCDTQSPCKRLIWVSHTTWQRFLRVWQRRDSTDASERVPRDFPSPAGPSALRLAKAKEERLQSGSVILREMCVWRCAGYMSACDFELLENIMGADQNPTALGVWTPTAGRDAKG